MGKFRKKPVVIEAVNTNAHPVDWPSWLTDAMSKDRNETGAVWGDGDTTFVFVQTLEGPLRISRGDYIIQGIHGELYPCKPDIFEATYEPAE